MINFVSMGKGRNRHLINKRDEALCRRYYYWTEVQRIRFDDVLKILSQEEFFISEERVMAIIRDKYNVENFNNEVQTVKQGKSKKSDPNQLSLFKDGI